MEEKEEAGGSHPVLTSSIMIVSFDFVITCGYQTLVSSAFH